MSAKLGTNICLRSKQALPGSAINRVIKQTVMSRITANYDKICFGIWLRGSRALKSAQEFISEPTPEQTQRDSLGPQVGFVHMLRRAHARVAEGINSGAITAEAQQRRPQGQTPASSGPDQLAVNQPETELITWLHGPIRRVALEAARCPSRGRAPPLACSFL